MTSRTALFLIFVLFLFTIQSINRRYSTYSVCVAKIWTSDFFFKNAAGRQLGFDPTGNSAVRSAVPENPTLEPNTKLSEDALLRYGHLKFSKMCEWALNGRHYSYFLH